MASLDDHREECDGVNCDPLGCAAIPLEELQQRVIDLWLGNDCWIPGSDWQRLAEALGVDPDRLQNERTRPMHARMAQRHPHNHEDWQILESDSGGKYCAACGEKVKE